MTQRLMRVIYRLLHFKEYQEASRIVDVDYYRDRYEDVRMSGIDPVYHYMKHGKKERRIPFSLKSVLIKQKRIDILATKHTMYVAKLLQGILQEDGFVSETHDITFDKYIEGTPYIIICPQFVKVFPSVYIAFQLEQLSVSNRWFNENYLSILKNAYAVFDYSLNNIKFLSRYSELSSKLFYVPIDYNLKIDNSADDYKYDVVFYGDPTSPRRSKAFEVLNKHNINVKILSGVFGEELRTELKKTWIIINIHYYENSLLETTRLSEALSLGRSLIISEHSTDFTEDTRFSDTVQFVDYGDYDDMAEKIIYWINHRSELSDRIASIRNAMNQRIVNSTTFYMNRFLLANDIITFDFFYDNFNKYIQFSGNKICLSLPESVARRNAFEKNNKYGFELFPAFKHTDGWVGCAMSYKFIFKKLIELTFDYVIICEDDVWFPVDFKTRFDTVQEYLANKKWDVFSGLMADINDSYYVKNKAICDGEIIAKLNKMVSMVFNVYNKSVFELFSNYDTEDRDRKTNTIDKYIQRKEIEVFCMWPFLVSQNSDLDSTLWCGKNSDLYDERIVKSQNKLKQLIIDYNLLYLSAPDKMDTPDGATKSYKFL